MKYKIIVDTQDRHTPSEERKEYEIDIEELHTRGKIYDSLVITKNESYVIRRIQKNPYNVLNILEDPIKEKLENINIELFEGNNYIYLLDTIGNKLCAEYIIKNEFTDIYVTKNTMNSSINQTAGYIELMVNQKLTQYATGEELEGAITELNSTIIQKADSISSTVAEKVGNNEIISKINQSAEQVQIDANKISLEGKEINLTGDEVTITSDNFNVDKTGTTTIISPKDNSTSPKSNLTVKTDDETCTNQFYPSQILMKNNNGAVVNISSFPFVSISKTGEQSSITTVGFIKRNEATGETSIVTEKGLEIQSNEGVTTSITSNGITTSNFFSKELKAISSANSNLYLGTGGEYSGITTNLRGNTVRLYAHSGGAVYLGYSGSTAVTSDEKLKNISKIDKRYVKFFEKLKPITYIYKEKGHRNHIGFGARQVEQALKQAGLTTEQFAGILKDTDVTLSKDETNTDNIHYDELYSLRYEEFIALNTMMIQKQEKQIKELQARVAELEGK